MESIVVKIAETVTEAEDDFIFRTIQPFSENIVERKINKRELTSMLVKNKEQRVLHRDGLEICPQCFDYVGAASKGMPIFYCMRCGQKIIRILALVVIGIGLVVVDHYCSDWTEEDK